MDHNQVKYSQYRLSFYQQPFKFGATALVQPFWTDGHEGPSSHCPRQVFSFYITLAPTLPEPAPCRLSWIKMAKNSLHLSWFSFCCLSCLTERQSWTLGSMQGRKHYCSGAELILLQKRCSIANLPPLPTNNCQQRNGGKTVKHTHMLNPSVHYIFKRDINPWLFKRFKREVPTQYCFF